MARSKYDYVKEFERKDPLPSQQWIVIQIQCPSLEEFLGIHNVESNDVRVQALVEDCLKTMLQDIFDVVCAYGAMSESSFVFHQSSSFFNRRASKLLSVLVSSFTSLFVEKWPLFFSREELMHTPVFSGAAYCFPMDSMVRGYFSLRAGIDKGCFVFKQKRQGKTEIISQYSDIASDTFWIGHSFLLQKKMSKRSIRKGRRMREGHVPFIGNHMIGIELHRADYDLLHDNWIVVRVDGRRFKKFSKSHGFKKPNDERALQLMDECAKAVLQGHACIACAYGISDEYSFIIRKNSCQQANNELISKIVSLFTGTYVLRWYKVFPDKKLKYAPGFDARAVCYPTDSTLRDYLAWRQVDCHINNVNNTCFWMLRELGLDSSTAHSRLKGTRSSHKQELLSNEFHVRYSELPAKYRKGSLLVRKPDQTIVHYQDSDVIGDKFWGQHLYILSHTSQPCAGAALVARGVSCC